MPIHFRPIDVSISSDICRTIFQKMSDEIETVVERLVFNKQQIVY